MGICSSCLGLGRRNNHGDDAETRRLLYDDPYRTSRYGYGSRGGAAANPYQQDPESMRREREMLEGIVQVMSDNVIEVAPSAQMWHQQSPLQNSAQGSGGSTSSGESQHLYQLMRDSELSQADLSMKTIKKGRKGPVFSGSRQGGVLGFKAVQDAIG